MNLLHRTRAGIATGLHITETRMPISTRGDGYVELNIPNAPY